MGYNSPQEVLGALVNAYYEERDLEATLSCVTDDVEWVGTEHNDSARGKEELRKLLTADIDAFPEAFSIKLEEPSVQQIGSDAVLFTVTGEQKAVPGVIVGFSIRGTACAIKTEEGWLFNNVHTSAPNSEIEKSNLQNELNTEREKQSALLDAVPGGIAMYRVKKDGRIATDYVSDGLAKICGYEDGRDIMKVMEYDSRRLVLPEDFPVVAAACKESLEKGIPTSVNYRVYSKAGDPVRLTLDSVVMKNVKLGEDDVAVFYAVQTLVNDETIRMMEDQKQMSALLDQMPCGLGLFEFSKKGVYTNYMNNAFYDLLGTKRENRSQYSGINTLGSAHPDDLPKINAALQKMTDGAAVVQIDYRINKEGSEWVWIHANAVVVKREKASVHLCIAFSDVTESKERELQLTERYRVEEKLREQMYKDAVMYIEYNLMTCRYEGENNLSKTYLSNEWEMTSQENYRKNMSTAVDAAYLDVVVEKLYAKNLLKAFQRGETSVSCEYRSKARPNMPPTWYRTSAMMVQRPDTGDVMAFIYIENIEKEKERQLALENSMSDGIESVAIIHIADGQAKIIRTNSKRIPKDIGTSFVYNDALVARSHKEVVEENEFSYQAARLSTVTRELATKDVYQYSVSMVDKAGMLKRRLFRFRYLDDRKMTVIMAISDITAVYLEEQEKKKQLEAALADARKASGAKAEFYSRMSHDMRTPMNGILGIAELSEDETDVDTLKDNIKKIRESGEYLLSLVNDTLDIQRIESGRMKLEPKIVRITEVVDSILDMVSGTARTKGVNLKYSKGNTDLTWYVRLDAVRVKQIFINLLSNAIKFTPTGGTVEFEFKLLYREGMISHDVVYVRDTGIGMSEEFQEDGIFKPFSQENNAVSANYAGSGLGLSIAKSLVELMGGRIEVESELGAGTVFAVYLDFERVDDAKAEETLRNEKKQSQDVSAKLKGKKILLVEDHPLNAEIAKKLLQKAGCEVTWAVNGQEAVSCFERALADAFDVILMDIRMPVMDGLTATEKIRNLPYTDAKTIPIIAMTANAYSDDVEHCKNAGMNAHIAKPIQPVLLYQTIAAFVGER